MNESPTRALVLGGGGAAGNAWLIGVLAGAGLDAPAFDVIIGTSAGATAAAQVTAGDPLQLYAAILEAPVPPPRPGVMTDHLERTDRLIAQSTDGSDMRRRMGADAIALAGTTDSQRWRSVVAARLSGTVWPAQRLLITAVDAVTGEPVVFDRDSGVDLVDAVAASTAGGFAHTIGGRWYIDGGYRANADNADLATGYDEVLVLSPLGGRSRFPREWGMRLDTQVEALRSQGSIVETLFPDDAALAAFGPNMMDLAARAPAARAGYAQGRDLAARLPGC